METNVEKLEDNRAKVTVTVEASEIDKKVNAAYKDAAKKYQFPGFRKGKAPRAVIDSALGAGYILGTVTEDVINEAMPVAIDGSGLFTVGQADFDEVQPIAAGQDFVFSFTIALRDEIELSSYEPVAIEMPAAETTDEEIDAQYEAIIEQYASFEEAGAHTKSSEGDRLVMSMVGKDDKGESIETLTSGEFQYTIGSGLFPAAFDEKVTGLTVGESVEFTMEVGDKATAYTNAVMGKTATIAFEITVKSVMVKMSPVVDDAWVQDNFGFETVAELRERVADSVEQQKTQFLPRVKEDRVLYALIERVEGEAPAAMVEEQEQDLLQDFFQQLQRSGQTYDAYLKANDLTAQQLKEDIKLQAADIVKQNLALDAWARHFELECSEGDIQAEFIKADASEWEDLYENWKRAGRLHMVREGVLRNKALENAIASAVVTEIPYGQQADAE